ncbi:hypothetical protein DM2_3108 [Halorubrum sp. DM2]|nr:hypothetical protein BN903_60 [Halorubrum sp. AJ67]VTT87070.1 hypothetical protein DM2_3108 [Halorubrum sp. DM2]
MDRTTDRHDGSPRVPTGRVPAVSPTGPGTGVAVPTSVVGSDRSPLSEARDPSRSPFFVSAPVDGSVAVRTPVRPATRRV